MRNASVLPTGFTIRSAADVPAMFILFAVAFALLGIAERWRRAQPEA